MAESTPVGCKPCTKCGRVKPLSQFHRRSDGANGGYMSHCAPCVRATAQERYWNGRVRPPEQPPAPKGFGRCSKCREVKPLSAFGSRGKGRSRRTDCKSCVAAASKARYQNDPEVRAKHKILRDRWRAENPTFFAEYYRANRESMIAAAIQYAKDHPPDPEQVRAWARERYVADPETARAKYAAQRAANPEKYRELGRLGQHRRRARLRGLPSAPYTMAELVERDGTACVLCGGGLDFTVVYPELLAPTIEHLECISWGTAGDEPSNVALSHWDCNNRRRDKPHPAAARKRAELLAHSTSSRGEGTNSPSPPR